MRIALYAFDGMTMFHLAEIAGLCLGSFAVVDTGLLAVTHWAGCSPHSVAPQYE